MPATILCVQEDREVGRLYAETLESEGYEVLSARDARGAFQTLRRHRPDLVILDVHLPRQDGFEILAELRAQDATRELPVILLSEGDVTRDVSVRATALGALAVESAPMPADRLVAAVKNGVSPPEKGVESSPLVPKTADLERFPFPELLRALQLDAFDGVVLFDQGKRRKAIEFRTGWPISIKSNLVSECLGGYLVRHELCTQAELDESVARVRSGEGLQGEILVAMDVLDEESVVEALRGHAFEKLLDLFTWRRGRFEVRAGTHVQRGSSIGVEEHPCRLIVEGVRRKYPQKLIDRYFGAHRDAFLVPSVDSHSRVAELGLSDEDAAWLRGLDGSMVLGALLEAPEEIRRLAFGLISIEALTVEQTAGDPEDAVAAVRCVSGGAARISSDSKQDEALRVELAELANGMQNKDHYGVLGVPSTADDSEIRAAYASLAKQAHPDRFHGASSSVRQLAAQVFSRVSEAYSAVATRADRERYVQQAAIGRKLAAVEDEGRRALQAETEFQRGEALVASRDYEGALLCFGRAMEYFPSEGEYRAHYGWCLHLCHPDNEVMLSEALEHCREGLKLAKDREKPYLLLGRLYKAMGKPVAAKRMFSRAVQIKPQCVEAMRELRIMNMRGEGERGVLKRIFRR